jgi:hypothetical protein
VSKLAKLESRFAHEKRIDRPKLKGFHKPQRARTVLAAAAPPQRGVRQPMPERK